ncbi:MAG: sulfide-dependent adenosine diphosphate thiazole synthase [Candidatus Omnitrophota bacterium]|nr:sulfide-dependent adenosine diphosphate thiazole synthase [Candidatus Omnitrophota bacterium]
MSSKSLSDIVISRAIVESFSDKLLKHLKTDVAIVGAGPAGLVAGYYLAVAGIKVTMFERKLSIGGGMWGGGMMFNEIVVQEKGKKILKEFGVPVRKYRENYYTADSVTAVSTLCSRASLAGARIFNLIEVEDLMIKNEVVKGLVVNWSAVKLAGLHVDPLSIESRFVVDATGHPCEVSRILEEKARIRLSTETGGVEGERPMWAETGENTMLTNTREVFPNVYVAGMAANAVFGSPRMGPIFGGMLISGERVAQLIKKRLKKS